MSDETHSSRGNVPEAPTMTVLPESEGEFLVLSLQGVISLKDFNRCLYKEAVKRIEKYGHFSMMHVFSPTYKSWALEAADASFRSMVEMGQKTRKLAYLNPPERKIFQMSLQKPMFSADIRYFQSGEFNKALEWLKT